MIVSLFLVKEVYQIRELAKVVKILSYISPLIILGLMVVIFSVWGANGSVVSAFFERFVLFGDVFTKVIANHLWIRYQRIFMSGIIFLAVQ